MTANPYRTAVLAWYDANARDLPWRSAEVTPWGVLVSELMLQQTPVARVLPAWHERGWNAGRPRRTWRPILPGEAVRMWGRLGYPRRALRLHACATVIVERHGGEVPDSYDELLALPGVGDIHGGRGGEFRVPAAARRAGHERAAGLGAAGEPAAVSARTPPPAAEYRLAESLLPEEPAVAARWGVAVMELGALVCTARSPRCGACPVVGPVRVGARGVARPHDGPPRRGQRMRGRTARSAAGCWRCCGRRPVRCTEVRCWTRCGMSRSSGNGRWTVWWLTVWWTRWRRASTRCPN